MITKLIPDSMAILRKLRKVRGVSDLEAFEQWCSKHSGVIDTQPVSRRDRKLLKEFDDSCKSFEEWCLAHNGTLPAKTGQSEEERSLAKWLSNKLSSYRRGKLPNGHLTKLRKIPGLSDFPHMSRKDKKLAREFTDTCKRVEEWCATHHGGPSNQKELSSEEMSMAVWFKNKLAFYRSGKLADDQIFELRKIPLFRDMAGFAESKEESHGRRDDPAPESLDKHDKIPLAAQRLLNQSDQDDLRFTSFEEWCSKHPGTLPKRNGENAQERSLAQWLSHKLHSYRRGTLSEYQVAKLRKIPNFLERIPSRSEKFDLTCSRFRKWCATHNGTLPKERGETAEERSLAIWLRKKLQTNKRGKLPDEQLAKLKAIPGLLWFWEEAQSRANVSKFDLTCRRMENWCGRHCRASPKENAESKEEQFLARWCRNILYNYRLGKLSENQVAKLRSIPNFLQGIPSQSAKFDLACASFQEWCAAHGGALPTQRGGEEEKGLAKWLSDKLRHYQNGQLPDEQLVKLRRIPCLSSLFNALENSQIPVLRALEFDRSYSRFKTWCATHKGTLPQRSGETAEERSAASWFMRNLYLYRHGKLPDVQLAKLRTIPGLSDFPLLQSRQMVTQKFDVTCKSLKHWCAMHGTLPKRSGEGEDERVLAVWLKNKLSSCRRGTLPGDQLDKLRKIPGLSNFPQVSGRSQMLPQRFECTYKSFEEWCATHKGAFPSKTGKTKAERSLATWLKNKRQSYRRGKLPDCQLAKLQKSPWLGEMFGIETT